MFDFTGIDTLLPWFFPVVVSLFGACIGSFLNVVISRVPAGESIVTPGSHCNCGQPIAWYDNIPVLSWFMLRGRARCCGQPYSVRYAMVELLTAALFLACWLLFAPAKAVVGMVFLSILVAATLIDFDHMIIPDVFTLGGGVLGLLLSLLVPALHGQHSDLYVLDSLRSVTIGLQGLFVGSGLVLWIALVAEALLRKEAMGFGDVKFAGAIGAFCGWQGAVFALFGGAIIGTVWIALAFLWRKISGQPARTAPPTETPDGEPTALGFGVHVPFGPMLAIAAALHFLCFHQWVADYFAQISELI